MATLKVSVPSHSSQDTRTSYYTGNLIESLISAVEQTEQPRPCKLVMNSRDEQFVHLAFKNWQERNHDGRSFDQLTAEEQSGIIRDAQKLKQNAHAVDEVLGRVDEKLFTYPREEYSAVLQSYPARRECTQLGYDHSITPVR